MTPVTPAVVFLLLFLLFLLFVVVVAFSFLVSSLLFSSFFSFLRVTASERQNPSWPEPPKKAAAAAAVVAWQFLWRRVFIEV